MSSEPIIPGFHPDPSICRVGDRYYLINSSFEYLPGIPVHESTDLVNWTLIGNALTRHSQLAEGAGYPSSGIYAPTIRHHDGRFWIIGTNVNDIPLGRGHFLIHAADPAGPWSDPVCIGGAIGIDPDIVWDEEGTAHVTWCSLDPSQPGIRSAPVDLQTGTMISASRQLWEGTGLAAPEGPHLYRKEGWWYLLLAEGGTERGHAVTIARARSLEGPFEAAPHNPILSHRSLHHPVQNTGHADLIELSDGTWAAVYLGVRPRGQSPSFHVNGRETFLAGIDWVDGWPVFKEDRYEIVPGDHAFVDRFESEELDPRWLGVGRYPGSFARPSDGVGRTIEAPTGEGSALLVARATDPLWSASARFTGPGTGRFVLRVDDNHWYGLTFDGTRVETTAAIGSIRHELAGFDIDGDSAPTLRITAKAAPLLPHGVSLEPDIIQLAVTVDGEDRILAELDGRYLSTEVAGGFTGRVFGVEALSGSIRLLEVQYTPEHPAPAS